MGTWASARNVAHRQGPDDPDGGLDDPAIVGMIKGGACLVAQTRRRVVIDVVDHRDIDTGLTRCRPIFHVWSGIPRRTRRTRGIMGRNHRGNTQEQVQSHIH